MQLEICRYTDASAYVRCEAAEIDGVVTSKTTEMLILQICDGRTRGHRFLLSDTPVHWPVIRSTAAQVTPKRRGRVY